MNGACSYAFVQGATCDDGNPCTVADTCATNACTGTPKVCNAPPASVCISGAVLRTYDVTGMCNGGLCVYQQHDITCAGGPCTNDACQTDPCAGVTCKSPPSSCFGASGTCSKGSCSYPFANGVTCNDANPCTINDACNAGVCTGAPMACDTPPPSVCADSATLEVYAQAGTCSGGTCGYTSSFVPCSAGCANAACASAGWTSMTSNTNQSLYGVWGSSATAVWAVGAQGVAVFFNGAQWVVKSPPSPATLYSVHGTAANNVFAAGDSGKVYKWSGAAWSVAATLPSGVVQAGVFVDGPDTLWVGGSTGSYFTSLYRVVNGAVTLVGSAYESFDSGINGAAVWASSPTDVWVTIQDGYTAHYDGMTVTNNPSTTVNGDAIWASSATNLLIGGRTFIQQWNGSGFTLIPTGLTANLGGLSGTSATRVFGAIADGSVIYFDGSSITNQKTPASNLNAIFAAATGEVFAVGNFGAIVKGP